MVTAEAVVERTESKEGKFVLPCSREGCSWKRPFPNVREARAVYQAHWQEAHKSARQITVRKVNEEVSAAYNGALAAPESPSQTPPSSKVSEKPSPGEAVGTRRLYESEPTGIGRPLYSEGAAIVELDPAEILPSAYQPRSQASLEKDLELLVEDIRTNGQQVPVAVRPCTSSSGERWMLLYGERRLRAVEAIGGGLKVKAIVQDVGELDAIKAAFGENGNRKDLTPLETARAVDRLLAGEPFKITQVQTGEILGISQPTVANMRKILRTASPEALETVERGLVLWSALRALLPLAADACAVAPHHEVAHEAFKQAEQSNWQHYVINEEMLARAVRKVVSREWRALDEKARQWRYSVNNDPGVPVESEEYQKAAGGRIHDFGKDGGLWACNRIVYDMIAKAKLAEASTGAAGAAEAATPAKTVRIVQAHVEKEVLPQLLKQAPSKTSEEIAATIGKPLDLSQKSGTRQAIRGTGEHVESWGLEKGQLAVDLKDARPKMADKDECDACPHGGRRFALVRDWQAKDHQRIAEICTNNQCLAKKIRTRNSELDAKGDARREREDRLAAEACDAFIGDRLMPWQASAFLLAALAESGQVKHKVSGGDYINDSPLIDWLSKRLNAKIERNYDAFSVANLNIPSLQKALAGLSASECARLVFDAALAMVRDPRTGRHFKPEATRYLKVLVGGQQAEPEAG